MKKNISKLIAQIKPAKSAKDSFKITSKNVGEYVNKILVNQEDLNRPDITETFVKDQMKEYPASQLQHVNKNVAELNSKVKEKTQKTKIEDQLYHLEKNKNFFDALHLEEVMAEIRFASKQKKIDELMREKLKKLEVSIAFTLENEDIDPCSAIILTQFVNELTTIINRSSKIF